MVYQKRGKEEETEGAATFYYSLNLFFVLFVQTQVIFHAFDFLMYNALILCSNVHTEQCKRHLAAVFCRIYFILIQNVCLQYYANLD